MYDYLDRESGCFLFESYNMELSFDFWYLFPAAIVIATIAMSSGIGGAVFFSPLFMLGLKLDPRIAIGSALITELFGFTSGLIAYHKARLIDYRLARDLLVFSIPAAMLGTYYADVIPAFYLKLIFALGLVLIGWQMFNVWRKERKTTLDHSDLIPPTTKHTSQLTDAYGKTYHYTICQKPTGQAFAAIGGAFVGMISVGLAELQEYHLVARCKVPTPVAVATSIFVVVVTVLVASAGHFLEFIHMGPSTLNQVLNVVVFTIPGVILGGQIGPRLQKSLPEDIIKVAISVLFVTLGLLMLFTLTFKP